jgi:hypothetical protein
MDLILTSYLEPKNQQWGDPGDAIPQSDVSAGTNLEIAVPGIVLRLARYGRNSSIAVTAVTAVDGLPGTT